MDENVTKFNEKLKELLELANKKKNALDDQEVSDVFSDKE
ncbi:MAG: RNA polymerase subunit sigma-70, partial [Lachnospiraceae bacterium]|nr:RNA polymerase subunit sigma-70 [Lachnospiraceae bacterium]